MAWTVAFGGAFPWLMTDSGIDESAGKSPEPHEILIECAEECNVGGQSKRSLEPIPVGLILSF